MSIYVASTTAPVNIATLKYWGKRDSMLNLPTNSSISVTLSQEDLRTLTSAATGPELAEDRLWLNGKPESLGNARTQQCLADLRALRRALETEEPDLPRMSEWKLHIVSENNFPTAAGLASSAAGFAALVVAVAKLYGLPQDYSEISKIARKGSGSACRSLYGGYVAWEMGAEADGSDSRAVQIADVEHWPEMRAAILVVSADRKDTPSTSGMQQTVHTSDLFKERVATVVPRRYGEMAAAIRARDFATFARLTMQDSNSFHATCLDSFPPIFYMNDTSRRIVKLCHLINEFYNETIVAYTFDAGPNAVLYYLAENEARLCGFLSAVFGANDGWETTFSTEQRATFAAQFDECVRGKLATDLDDELHRGVARLIFTKVGPGPQDTKSSLIDPETGLPR
ncbi:AGL232Cp [Eremothecium gossypii ATCC 10895]|uniref:Diphosphomevalonate decarboxylase n=1 Tax=Eremothecium gossypii (strain ATCC 10895 / CBS 109.51 / FGSC 9923 / NRRL Y-1056) TaxID=284811 RepID=MVD1_EREGS|nr:AGL232Cp [Eremothecium gossypii ATCC 10895]Q751D8.2 RecName: Full=Diphosphomevalonate decarboxylase; AltName: Full=Ergosterol biosynthesis protein 19; AltName: Full=Mevalonate pyrophosphate decarboxylase; Short=MPD; AltName: Full=Mevalonate-5-diphosphate decarboxylase; Short=MDD; Short=MDDase [Eremothecium gossypii ATCC 10895]AAS54259.2 AGL232Cp [Eremothecium gossypii ATCC 10895]